MSALVGTEAVMDEERGTGNFGRRLNDIAKQEREAREFGQDAILRRLGQLAKQRREEMGSGRISFAKAAGIGSDKTLQDFEFGRRLPNGTTLRKIERALGWRYGVMDDVLRNVDRKASSIVMEELDEFEPNQPKPLDMIPTADLLEEVINRLTTIRSAISTPGTRIEDVMGRPGRNLFDLAASTNMEHLEDDAEAEGDEND